MSDRRGWSPPTMRECYQSTVNNARASEQRLVMARQRVRFLMAGDNGLPDARAAVQQAIAEIAHWHNYADYFRQRCETEGDLTVPKMGLGNGFLALVEGRLPF